MQRISKLATGDLRLDLVSKFTDGGLRWSNPVALFVGTDKLTTSVGQLLRNRRLQFPHHHQHSARRRVSFLCQFFPSGKRKHEFPRLARRALPHGLSARTKSGQTSGEPRGSSFPTTDQGVKSKVYTGYIPVLAVLGRPRKVGHRNPRPDRRPKGGAP